MGAAWWMARFADVAQHPRSIPLALSSPSPSLSFDPHSLLLCTYSPLFFPSPFSILLFSSPRPSPSFLPISLRNTPPPPPTLPFDPGTRASRTDLLASSSAASSLRSSSEGSGLVPSGMVVLLLLLLLRATSGTLMAAARASGEGGPPTLEAELFLEEQILDVELFLEEQKLEAELLRLLERLLLTLLLALLVPDAPPEYPLSLSHLQQTNNKRQFKRETAKGRREMYIPQANKPKRSSHFL